MTIAELGERALLARIASLLNTDSSPRSPDLIIGIGDDAAVVARARNTHTVLTTDALVEGVHFDRRFGTATDLGFRALAVNLSDLAAMGARPRWALLSLALPGHLTVAFVDTLVGAVGHCAHAFGSNVVGGNVTSSPGPLVIEVTAVGEVQPRRALLRSGGRPGDELWVSGWVGAARAGLQMLQTDPAASGACVQRYLRPEPRVRLGVAVGRARAARAAMDLSDGLADAVHQLAEASGCGAELSSDRLPVHSEAQAWWQARGEDHVRESLIGGDDYELLLAIPRAFGGRLKHVRQRVTDPLTRIGVLTKGRGVHLVRSDGTREALPEGFDHWSKNHDPTG